MDWSSIADILRLVGGVGKVGTGIMSAFQKEPLPMGLQESMQAASNANTYSQAALDPSSPYFKPIQETEELRGRGDLISSVDQIIRQMASRNATGRSTINPERRDEAVWGVLAQGFREAGLRARELARQKLMDAAGAQTGIARSYATLSQPSMLNSLFNRSARNAGTAGAFEGVNALSGIFGQKKGAGRTHESFQGPGSVGFGNSSIPNWWSDSYDAGYP